MKKTTISALDILEKLQKNGVINTDQKIIIAEEVNKILYLRQQFYTKQLQDIRNGVIKFCQKNGFSEENVIKSFYELGETDESYTFNVLKDNGVIIYHNEYRELTGLEPLEELNGQKINWNNL